MTALSTLRVGGVGQSTFVRLVAIVALFVSFIPSAFAARECRFNNVWMTCNAACDALYDSDTLDGRWDETNVLCRGYRRDNGALYINQNIENRMNSCPEAGTSAGSYNVPTTYTPAGGQSSTMGGNSARLNSCGLKLTYTGGECVTKTDSFGGVTATCPYTASYTGVSDSSSPPLSECWAGYHNVSTDPSFFICVPDSQTTTTGSGTTTTSSTSTSSSASTSSSSAASTTTSTASTSTTTGSNTTTTAGTGGGTGGTGGTGGGGGTAINETGTPTGEGAYSPMQEALDALFGEKEGKLNDVTNPNGKDTSWGWFPSWLQPGIAACQPFELGTFPIIDVAIRFDICPILKLTEQILSFLWVVGTLFAITSLVSRTMNGVSA